MEQPGYSELLLEMERYALELWVSVSQLSLTYPLSIIWSSRYLSE